MLNAMKSTFGRSIHLVRRFFFQPIRIRPGTSAAPVRKTFDPEARARKAERLRVRHMRRGLHQLLEQHPGSRLLMRHLAVVETAMRDDGFEAVARLPVAVSAKAHHQLELLVRDWSSEGLAELRSRLAVIAKEPRPPSAAVNETADAASSASRSAPPEPEIDTFAPLARGLSTFDDAEVTEAYRAAFAEMERSWLGRTPAASPPPGAS